MPPITPPTRLDANQVLQGAFDEATSSLRTSSSATIVPGSFEVSISAVDDTIALADATTGTKVGVTATNELKVYDVKSSPPGTPTIYNITGVTAGAENSYSFPANTKKIYIKARKGILKVAYINNGTFTNAYIHVARGSSYSVDGVSTSSTVYVSSDFASDVIEIQTWV
jgi:hypothetical protein